MRVHGEEAFFGDTPPDRRQRSNAQAFRRGREVGQVVRGRLVGPAEGGLSWVAVAGHTLLASLDHAVPPGQELLFRIERLVPELVLKDITPPAAFETDPARVLADLTGARAALERRIAGLFPDTPSGPPLDLTAARRHFLAALAADPSLRAAWERVNELARLISAWLPSSEGRLRFVPWILPGLTQTELLETRQDAGQGGPARHLRLFGRLPRFGRLAVLATWQPGHVRYRLLLEQPTATPALTALAAAVVFGRASLVPDCLAAGPLPPALAGGFLSRLLADRARPFTGLRLQV